MTATGCIRVVFTVCIGAVAIMAGKASSLDCSGILAAWHVGPLYPACGERNVIHYKHVLSLRNIKNRANVAEVFEKPLIFRCVGAAPR